MIKRKIQAELFSLLRKESLVNDLAEVVLVDAKPGFGDFQINLSKISKEHGKNPVELAAELAGKFSSKLASAESKAAFLNFTITISALTAEVTKIFEEKEEFGRPEISGVTGKKIQVEFISANPTGPLTLGNGRGGFGGDVLARLFQKAGATVEREYYVNDGGNQIKVLGDALKVAAGKMETTDEVYRGEYIEEWVKNHQTELEKTEDSFLLGQIAAHEILEKHIKPSIKRIGIKFDNFFHEKELIATGEVETVVQKLKEFGMTREQDGALWLKTTEFGDTDDRVLIKSNGENTYFINDIAYHFDKLYKRKFDKVVDLWGADHQGHVTRMQAGVTAMGCPGKLDILIFQLVRLIKNGQEFKMSKRKGTFVTLDELLSLIGGKERDAADVARFFFLSREFNTHMDFDLDLAKERSEKNPVFYVKYAYARIHGILEKSKTQITNSDPDFNLLQEKEELALIKELIKLPEVIESILLTPGYPLHNLTFYSREIATKFHSFYDKCRVIDVEKPELTAARLGLVRATEIVLRIVMEDLLGIEAPARM